MAGSGPTSGVKIDDNCMTVYKELQKNHKLRYIVYKLSDDLKRIEVDKAGPKEATYDEFVQELLDAAGKGEGRYGIFDMDYQLNERKLSKVVFIAWVPDTLKVKQKMLYSSSLRAFKNKLEGLHVELQCNDDCDLQPCAIMQKCMEKGYD